MNDNSMTRYDDLCVQMREERKLDYLLSLERSLYKNEEVEGDMLLRKRVLRELGL